MGQQKQKANKELDAVDKKAMEDAINRFYSNRQNGDVEETINPSSKAITQQQAPVAPPPVLEAPKPSNNVNLGGFQDMNSFEKSAYQQQAANIDPNLNVEFEIIKFPSKGLYYQSRLPEVTVEKMTSIDEDVLATSSLIENGTVLDVLIKRKVKSPINTDELLVGDRNAILLFLRATSYGQEYEVRVTDPRTGIGFPSSVDLTKLKAKEITILPDERGEFSLQLPMRKVLVKFKILNYREVNHVLKSSEMKKEAYNTPYSEFGSMKLKAEVVEIEGNRNKDYITQFIDAMPAKDSAILKQKIAEVTPDINMNYEFTAGDGFKFTAKITVGVDFFFPFI